MAAHGRKFGRRTFDELFSALHDPWNYSSPYETTKYGQTLRLVPEPPPRRALEVGCAEGHFTLQLAARVGQLMAVDISEVALERARQRCAPCTNVVFEQLDLFESALPGVFELILCSEVLFYADDMSMLQQAAGRLADALAPDGCLVTAHAHLVIDGPADAAFDWEEPHVAGAAGIEQILLQTGRLELSDEIRTDLYRVQRYVCRDPSQGPPGARVHRRIEPTGVLSRKLNEAVVWGEKEPEPLLTILAYHRVAEHGPPALDPYRVVPATFEEMLRALWEAGYRTVPLEQWRQACVGRAVLPRLPLLLTFDDGYLDFLTDAWPALKRYGFGALVSLVTDRVGGSNEWDAEHGPPIPLMDWDAVADLHHEGIAFAAHSATHRRLTQLDPVEARREILSSKVQLDERLEDEVTTFVYPWSDKSERVEQLVSDCGFVLALNGRVGIASPNDNPFDLPRIEIEGDATPKTMLDQIARVREQSRATGTPAPPHPPERWSTRARHLRWRVVGKARSLVAGRRKP